MLHCKFSFKYPRNGQWAMEAIKKLTLSWSAIMIWMGYCFFWTLPFFIFIFSYFFSFFCCWSFYHVKIEKKLFFFYTKVGFLIKSFIKRSLLKGIVGIPLISPVSMFVLNVFKRLRGLMKLLIQQLVV